MDNIPSTIKSQMSRLTFRQMSVINSTNIIECGDAVALEEKECILFTNKYTRIKVPFISKEIIQDNIKDSLQNIPVVTKVEPKYSTLNNLKHYSWGKTTAEEFALMKDITVRDIKTKSSIATEVATNLGVIIKTKKRKNGVISLEEVLKDANSKR